MARPGSACHAAPRDGSSSRWPCSSGPCGSARSRPRSRVARCRRPSPTLACRPMRSTPLTLPSPFPSWSLPVSGCCGVTPGVPAATMAALAFTVLMGSSVLAIFAIDAAAGVTLEAVPLAIFGLVTGSAFVGPCPRAAASRSVWPPVTHRHPPRNVRLLATSDLAHAGGWCPRRSRSRTRGLVPPRGFEPLISTLKGWRPRPLDDGGRVPRESTRGPRAPGPAPQAGCERGTG